MVTEDAVTQDVGDDIGGHVLYVQHLVLQDAEAFTVHESRMCGFIPTRGTSLR